MARGEKKKQPCKMNDQVDKVSKHAEKKLSLGRRDIPRARTHAPEGKGQVSSPEHWVHSQ